LYINLLGGKFVLCTLADDVVRSCPSSQFLFLQSIKYFMGLVCTTLHSNEVYERIILAHNASLWTTVTRRQTGPYSVTVKHMHGPQSLKAVLCFNMNTAFIIYGRIIQTSELFKPINKAPHYN